MKTSFFRFFLLSTAVFCCISAKAQQAQRDVMQLPLPLQKSDKTIDQQLIELAEAADVNFLADATVFAAAPPPKSVAPDPRSMPRPFFGSLLASLAKERDLSYLRYAPNTFLFWPQPDPVMLARGLAAGKDSSVEVVGDWQQLNTLTSETSALFANYLQKRVTDSALTARNTPAREGAPLDIERDELPEPLRQRISALALAYLLGNPSSSGIWFSDTFWRTARLRIVPSNVTVNGQTTTHNLEVVGLNGKETVNVSLDSR